jgi:hypothetical protein
VFSAANPALSETVIPPGVRRVVSVRLDVAPGARTAWPVDELKFSELRDTPEIF